MRRELGRRFEAIHDLLVPDNRNALAWTQVDHVVRLPGCLVCIETKNYEGLIFGTERQAQWTQALGGRKHRFQNPLRQNYKHVQAVAAASGGAPTKGLVVFAGKARFPKGLPEGVCRLDELTARLKELATHSLEDATQEAWRRLLEAASTDRNDRADHLSDLKAVHGSDRRLPIGLALFLCGVAVAVFGVLY